MLGCLAGFGILTMLAVPSRKPPPAEPVRQVNYRLSVDMFEWLAAASGVLGRTHSHIVTEALRQYRATLSDEDQQLIEQTIARRRKP